MKKYLIIAMLSFFIAGCGGPDLEQATSELNALLDDSKIGKYVEESTILTLPKKADEHGYGIRISVEASKDFNELTSKDKYLLIKDLQKLYYELYSNEDDEVSCGKQDCYVQEIELKAGLLTYKSEFSFTDYGRELAMGNEIIYSEKELDSEEINEEASKNGTPTFSGSSTLNNKEKDIYLYMKQVYDELTNYGENYIPEVHDPQVAEMAAAKFGISPSKAGQIYIEGEMGNF